MKKWSLYKGKHTLMQQGENLFLLYHLPFISFNLVKSRSKLSTSASPAVRFASSWMSKSVIASEETNTVQKKRACGQLLFTRYSWTSERKNNVCAWPAAVPSPTIVPSWVSVLVPFSEWLVSSVCAPSTGKLEDYREKGVKVCTSYEEVTGGELKQNKHTI